MRRILIEKARRKERIKDGGDVVREDLDLLEIEAPSPREDLIAIDAALTKLQAVDATAAELVQLRYFAGLSIAESAAAMDISPRTADRIWVFAKAWLHREIS
jgi:RNA polymerase sigma factor (TIGR02999 family)